MILRAGEEKTYRLDHGDVMVLTSDGITEAHNPDGEMYGFARLMRQVANKSKGDDVVASLVGDLEKWSGPGSEQEDDITLVVVRRTASAERSASAFDVDPEVKRLVSFPHGRHGAVDIPCPRDWIAGATSVEM